MLGCEQTFHDCVLLPVERRHDDNDDDDGDGDQGVEVVVMVSTEHVVRVMMLHNVWTLNSPPAAGGLPVWTAQYLAWQSGSLLRSKKTKAGGSRPCLERGGELSRRAAARVSLGRTWGCWGGARWSH